MAHGCPCGAIQFAAVQIRLTLFPSLRRDGVWVPVPRRSSEGAKAEGSRRQPEFTGSLGLRRVERDEAVESLGGVEPEGGP